MSAISTFLLIVSVLSSMLLVVSAIQVPVFSVSDCRGTPIYTINLTPGVCNTLPDNGGGSGFGYATINCLTLGGTVSLQVSTYSSSNCLSGEGPVLSDPLGTCSAPAPDSFGGNSYYVEATSCLIGDPSFMGLRGQSYQVHGIDGNVYNIISEERYQVNSQFVFLSGVHECPVLPSTHRKPAIGCFSHDGSYLGSLGIKTNDGSKFQINSGSAKKGFAALLLNGIPLTSNYTSVLLSITVISTHELEVRVGNWYLQVVNIDGFVNIMSASLTPGMKLSSLGTHGLLGQTWQAKTYNGSIHAIEGEVDDYAITGNDLFGDDFIFNKFVSLMN